jgi:hypothetical protein
MSTQYRDPPKWQTNATIEAETQMLARLEASAALMRLIIQASADDMLLRREAQRDSGAPVSPSMSPEKENQTRDALGLDPQPQAAPAQTAPPTKPARTYKPRVHAPQMLALGQRAAELLIQLAPLIREKTVAFIKAGIDPRQILRRAQSMTIAQIFLDELGIDLENIERADAATLHAAMQRVQLWIRECKRGIAKPLRSPGKEGAEPSPREMEQADAFASSIREDARDEGLREIKNVFDRVKAMGLPRMPWPRIDLGIPRVPRK